MTALEEAARAAQHAPSVFNTQPWSWRITGDTMELFADSARQLDVVDKSGQLLLLSCGAALHHARVALAAAGYSVSVTREADPTRGLLATVRVEGTTTPALTDLAAAIPRRHSDRRAFGPRPVADEELTLLRRLVEAEGAYLHLVRRDQITELAISAESAALAERDDEAYQAELARWTSRPSFTGDGVPPEPAVQQDLRRDPLRDFDPAGGPGQPEQPRLTVVQRRRPDTRRGGPMQIRCLVGGHGHSIMVITSRGSRRGVGGGGGASGR
jgi:hypothetical protein